MTRQQARKRLAAGFGIETLENRRMLASVPVTFGGSNYDAGYQVKLDTDGNTIVAGTFSLTADFDPSKNGEFLLTAVGQTDGFIAKYSPDGALIWAGQFGGGAGKLTRDHVFSPIVQTTGEISNLFGPTLKGQGEYVQGLAIAPDDSIYVTGAFFGSADFDPTAGGFSIKSKGSCDIFLLKVNPDGSFVWARSFGGIFEDTAKSVALDSLGNPVVTGRFTRSADFNPTKTGVLTLNAEGRDDCFVMLLSSTGKINWAERFGSTAITYNQRDSGEDVTLDSQGNIYVTGSFSRSPDFDPGPGKFVLSTYGDTDIFVLKLSFEGESLWAIHMGGEYFDGGGAIAIGPDGSVYTAGYFSRTASLDPASADRTFTATYTGTINGARTNMYMSRLNSSDGSLIWSKQISTDGYGWLGDLDVQSDGTAVLTGGFSGNMTLTSSVAPSVTIASVLGVNRFPDNKHRKYSYDIFAALLDSNGDAVQYAQFGSTSDDFGGGVDIGDSNTPVLGGSFKGTVNFGNASSPFNKRSNGDTDVFTLNDPALIDIAS